MTDLVSVIIPVYNSASYLEECLRSVQAQSYQNLEIIVIDDGSSDTSFTIMEQFANQDNRFVLIQQENGGQSNARNKGLAICQGKYLVFIDSDDYVDPGYVELLLDCCIKNNTYVAMCRFTKEVSQLSVRKDGFETEVVGGSFGEIANELYKSKYPAMSPTCKIYHRTVYQNIRFHEGIIYEDGIFFFEVIDQINQITLLDSALYYYRTAEKSTLTSQISEKNFDVFKKNRILENFFKSQHPEELSFFYHLTLNLNDSIAIRCIQEKTVISTKLFEALYQQNKEYAKDIFPRNLFYLSKTTYKWITFIASFVFSNRKFGKQTTMKKAVRKLIK